VSDLAEQIKAALAKQLKDPDTWAHLTDLQAELTN
jgi:hypothetical protein